LVYQLDKVKQEGIPKIGNYQFPSVLVGMIEDRACIHNNPLKSLKDLKFPIPFCIKDDLSVQLDFNEIFWGCLQFTGI
jgi:hypothetical protein